jgi:cytochrome c oxidase cbb3-type subunit III
MSQSTSSRASSRQHPRRRRAELGVALLLAALAGCSQERSTSAGAADADAWHERGRAIYNYRCYFCHGYSGDAKTLAASYLEPRPRDFRAASLEQLPRERIARAVRR